MSGKSTQSWREVLLKLKSRGMNVPELAVGDGAVGFWAALEEIYPETHQQRCWMHKTMNVLNCLPKLTQAKAKKALYSIWRAETRADAEKAFDLFLETYEPKYPRRPSACKKTERNCWPFTAFRPSTGRASGRPIRLSQPSPPFATRTRRSRSCLTRDGMLHMRFKLDQCQHRRKRGPISPV